MSASTTEIGHEVRGVTRATRTGAAGAVGAAGSLVTLLAYVLVRSGLEQDPEVATLLAGAFVTVLGAAAAWYGATRAGKNTPSDPALPPVPVAVDMPDPDAIPDADQGVAGASGEQLPPAPSPSSSQDAQRG